MPNMNHTKYLSFLFPVPEKYFSSAVKVVKPFEINVHYSYDWRGVVNIERYSITMGMAQHIVKWNELEEELKLAAENNSKQYRKPGDIGFFRSLTTDDLYKEINDEAKLEIKEKERYGW